MELEIDLGKSKALGIFSSQASDKEWLAELSKLLWEAACMLLSGLGLMNWGMPCNLTAYYVKRQQII